MEKDIHTGTHRASPEEILKEKILSARKKPVPSEEEKEESHPGLSADESWFERNGPVEKEDEFHSVPSSDKTWFERNEYVVVGTIVLIVVIAGCIILNALGD
ncbi:MAG: hypothetical protein EPN37_12450 [Chitinophagaceae bacterium]|jgi:hypothetical protein|nr:MAG: hypothetical protein EPN37_12450 [Chitinophagaceae bacterium]